MEGRGERGGAGRGEGVGVGVGVVAVGVVDVGPAAREGAGRQAGRQAVYPLKTPRVDAMVALKSAPATSWNHTITIHHHSDQSPTRQVRARSRCPATPARRRAKITRPLEFKQGPSNVNVVEFKETFNIKCVLIKYALAQHAHLNAKCARGC